VGQPRPGVAPVSQQQRDPLERAAAQRDHPFRTGACGQHTVDDLLPRVHRIPAANLTAHGRVKPLAAEPGHPAQVTTSGAVQRDGQRGVPGGGLERLPCGVQHRRPGALQQVAHLLHLRYLLGYQPGPPDAQVPQLRPGLVSRLGQVAAQLAGQASDQHRVVVVGLVEGQVLSPPRPRAHQRLHAHERQAALGGQLPDHPPPVPGRLDRNGHAGEARRRSTLTRPVQRRP
jgi:hypothetical protein